jgi:hypothetical protein
MELSLPDMLFGMGGRCACCRCICPAASPAARRDLVDITAGVHAAGLYTNLITSVVGITNETLAALARAGLDHVQISIQDSAAASANHIAGYARICQEAGARGRGRAAKASHSR